MSNLILTAVQYSIVPERWCIKNSEDLFWTGESFEKEGRPMLYDKCQKANQDIHQILIQNSSGKKKEFVLPLSVSFYGDPSLPEEEVIEYLQRSLKMFVDSDTYGNGPDGNLVLPSIEWNKFQERE